MKLSFKIILFLVCIFTGGITKTYADSDTTDTTNTTDTLKNGRLIGYGVTNEADTQYVVIKIQKSDTINYFVYKIDGSPYCDYIFNMLTNPAFWDNISPEPRFYIVYDNRRIFDYIGKSHYKILRFTWRE